MMSYLLLFGLLSWLLFGLVAGLAAPGFLQLTRVKAIIVAVAGAVVGGLLATALGFGGLASFDLRSLVTSGLVSILALLATGLKG